MNKYFLFFILLVFIASISTAQKLRIKIVNENGDTIPNVIVKSRSFTSVTNKSGIFNITPFLKDTTITCTHIAYEKREINISEILKSGKIVLRYKTYKTDEINVSSDIKENEFNVDINDRIKLKYSQVIDAIKNKTPLFIKDYGGYSGLKTVSYRGLPSENTLVLFNEARVNDLRSGAFDFSTIGINSIEKVIFNEATIDGKISSGGIINLISGVSSTKNFLKLSASYSSLNSKSFSGVAKINSGKLSATLNFEHSFSPNEFPYKFENRTGRRANAQYDKKFFAINFVYNSQKTIAKIYAHYSTLNNGLPGFIVTNNLSSSKAKTETEQKLITGNFYKQFTDAIFFKSVLGINSSVISITDSTNELLINRSYERAEINSLDFNNKIEIKNKFSRIAFGTEFSYGKLNSVSPAFLGNSPYFSSRYLINNYFSPELIFGNFFFLINPTIGGTLSFIHSDSQISGTNEKTDFHSWLLFFNVKPLIKKLKLRISYSRSYRIPTFSEIYYSGIFSPEPIKPEKYSNFTSSFAYSDNDFLFRLSYYNINGIDKIVWMPTRLALQVPKNIKEIHSEGFELQFTKTKILKGLSFGIIYTFNNIRNVSAQSEDDNSYNKILVYSPQHQIKASVDYNYNSFYFGTSFLFVGKRYYTSDNNPRYVLPSYNLFDFHFAYSFNLFGAENKLMLNIYNAFNQEYFVIQSYPMPLRTAKLNLSVKLL